MAVGRRSSGRYITSVKDDCDVYLSQSVLVRNICPNSRADPYVILTVCRCHRHVTVPAGLDNVTYNWHLNGELKETGGSYTFGNDLPLGVYRLDVTVFSADKMRAGSAQHVFTVVAAGQVTLMWDPNSESDLVGYRIYYGIASRSYDNVIDVGNTETCTVMGLIPDVTYYFVATAYNTSGLESDYSNEIEYTVSL